MRICFVVPSDEFAASAGARIRIDRFAEAAPLFGAQVSTRSIRSFQDGASANEDAYVFVKTFNADSLLLADRLRTLGCLVGIDLFDDYFSQADDVRMSRYRRWLHALAPLLDFALCSTERMQAVFAAFRPDLEPFLLPDPSPPYDPRKVAALIDRKLTRLRRTGTLRVLWFGVGDNPYFSVGVHDLRAHAEELGRAARAGLDVRLRIVTNARALNAQGLAMLRRLPLPFQVVEWSDEREAEELSKAHVCFLPVGSQAFSRAKSLNRAVTALVAGCQVVSAGFPLYEPLRDFIYRDFRTLLTHAGNGNLLHAPERLDAFSWAMRKHANPYTGMKTLSAALNHMGGTKVRRPIDALKRDLLRAGGPLTAQEIKSVMRTGFRLDRAIVHGLKSSIEVHKFAGRCGALSVRSPFTALKANFDVRFDWHPGPRGVRILVHRPLLDDVNDDLRPDFKGVATVMDREFMVLDEGSSLWAGLSAFRAPHETAFDRLVTYRLVLGTLRQASARLFPAVRVLVNEETASLP